jgi:hypothetical protein
LGRTVDLEFAAHRAAEESAQGGLHDVVAFDPPRESAVQALLRQPAQTLGVAGKQSLRRLRIAVPVTLDKFGDGGRFVHRNHNSPGMLSTRTLSVTHSWVGVEISQPDSAHGLLGQTSSPLAGEWFRLRGHEQASPLERQ